MQTTLPFTVITEANKKTNFEEILESLNVENSETWPDKFGLAIRKWYGNEKIRPIRTLSLFSGGGGLDIGFHEVGFDIVQMVELESKYVETLKANTKPGKLLGNAEVLCMDIKNYEPDPNLAIDFIIGGPPCQTFSAAARRAAGVPGTTDPRGTLFEEYVRILKKLRPKGFLFENVYGIIGAQNGEPWLDIQKAFNEAGYTLFFRILDAADYGVPQHRERLIIVGVKDGEFLFPYPTHGPDSIGNQNFYTAREAVAGINNILAESGLHLQGRYGHLLPDIPPGLNYSFYTKEMGHPNPIFSWRSKFSDFLYKADPNKPVRTIKAQGGQYTGPFSWENRPFTIDELKRLQTFPDGYDIVGKRLIAIEQIGNSVPPQLARILAISTLEQVMGVKLPFKMNYLPKDKELSFRKRKRLLSEEHAIKAEKALREQAANKNSSPIKLISEKKLNYTKYLSRDFAWTSLPTLSNQAVNIEAAFNENSWEITASPDENDTERIKLSMLILPASPTNWPLEVSSVRLDATDLNTYLFTGLWKAFEELVLQIYGIADLVQLHGYYQYKSKFHIQLEFGHALQISPFWNVVRKVVQGDGVGEQYSSFHLASLWNVAESSVFPYLKSLREMGYEIRNNITNPQIKDGYFLIPYTFPTLTPRSTQLRKSLEKPV